MFIIIKKKILFKVKINKTINYFNTLNQCFENIKFHLKIKLINRK